MLLTAALALAIQSDDLRPYLPNSQYTVLCRLNVDLIGLGHKQTAFVATAQVMYEGDPEKGPFLCVVNRGKVIYKHRCNHEASASTGSDDYDRRPALQAMDVTGDGRPELIFVSTTMGASIGTNSVHILHWNGHEFAEILPNGSVMRLGIVDSLCVDTTTKPVVLHRIVNFPNPKEADMSHAEQRGLWRDDRFPLKGSTFVAADAKEIPSPNTVLKRKGMRLVY